jgi:hypothetical protein
MIYALRQKKQLNIEHIIPHNRSRWQHSLRREYVSYAVRIKKLPMGAVSEWGVNIMAAPRDRFKSSFSVTYALRKKK